MSKDCKVVVVCKGSVVEPLGVNFFVCHFHLDVLKSEVFEEVESSRPLPCFVIDYGQRSFTGIFDCDEAQIQLYGASDLCLLDSKPSVGLFLANQ